jgi:hypothetical protein
VAYLETWQGDDGSTYVRVVEDELENIVQYAPDGKVYINGFEATVSEVESDDIGGNTTIRRAGSGLYSTFSSTILSGTSESDYNGAETPYNSTLAVEFGDLIVNLTVTVVKAQIEAAAPGWVGKLGANFFEIMVNTMIKAMKAKHPDLKATSFKDSRISYCNNTTQSMKYKHVVYYYTGTYYTGTKDEGRVYYEERLPT